MTRRAANLNAVANEPNTADAVPPALHELEAEVMREVWDLGETTVREVLELLNAISDRERAYTTIMTILARLDSKGLVVRRREGKTDIFAPALTHDEYVEARARAEADALIEEFGEAALVNFARHIDKLDPGRRKKLRRLARGG